MEQRAVRNPKSVIYKIFLAILLVGMHGEYQFGRFNFFGSNMQYSSVEFVIGFSILLLCGYVLYTKTDVKEIFREKSLFWILSLFCLSLILSTIFARYKVEAVKYDIRIMVTMTLFFLLLQFFSKERLKVYALILLNVVGITVSLICVLKYFEVGWVCHVFGSWGKGSNTVYSASIFQHNNVFGNWLVLLIFVTLGQLQEISRKGYRMWLGASIGLFALTLPLSLSRSAWLALIVISSLCLWMKRKDKRVLKWAGMVLAVFAFGLAYFSVSQKRMAYTLNNIKTNGLVQAVGARVQLWQATIAIFEQSPVYGIGLNNYKHRYFEFIEYSRNEKLNAHNQYLNVLAEQGIFGFIVFMGFVGYLIALGIGNIMRGGNEFYALAIFAYLVGALFDYLWYDYSFIFMFWFVVILNMIERRNLELTPVK